MSRLDDSLLYCVSSVSVAPVFVSDLWLIAACWYLGFVQLFRFDFCSLWWNGVVSSDWLVAWTSMAYDWNWINWSAWFWFAPARPTWWLICSVEGCWLAAAYILLRMLTFMFNETQHLLLVIDDNWLLRIMQFLLLIVYSFDVWEDFDSIGNDFLGQYRNSTELWCNMFVFSKAMITRLFVSCCN